MAIIGTRVADTGIGTLESPESDTVFEQLSQLIESQRAATKELRLMNLHLAEAYETTFTSDDIEPHNDEGLE